MGMIPINEGMIPDNLDVFPYVWGMIPDILHVFPFVWGTIPVDTLTSRDDPRHTA
jgi:hypothetical protein